MWNKFAGEQSKRSVVNADVLDGLDTDTACRDTTGVGTEVLTGPGGKNRQLEGPVAADELTASSKVSTVTCLNAVRVWSCDWGHVTFVLLTLYSGYLPRDISDSRRGVAEAFGQRQWVLCYRRFGTQFFHHTLALPNIPNDNYFFCNMHKLTAFILKVFLIPSILFYFSSFSSSLLHLNFLYVQSVSLPI